MLQCGLRTWSRAEFLSRQPAARRRRISLSAQALPFASCSLRGPRHLSLHHVPCTTWTPALPAVPSSYSSLSSAMPSAPRPLLTTPRPSHPPTAHDRPREQMSLLDTKTYKRPDAEVLPLITHATAKAKDGVRRISHQRCCARRAGHRPLSRAAIRGTSPLCRPAGRPHAPSATGRAADGARVRPSAAADRRRFDCSSRAPRAARRGSAHPGGEAGRVSWRGDGECALAGGAEEEMGGRRVYHRRSAVCSNCSRDARESTATRSTGGSRGTAAGGDGGGRATLHIRHRSRAPSVGRLDTRAVLACPHNCSFAPLLAVCATYRSGTRPSTALLSTVHRWRWCRRCSRRTRRPPRRRPRYAVSAIIGGATATRTPVSCAIVARPPPASSLSHPSVLTPARRVCRVQDGSTPLHYAAWYSSSEVVVQALLEAYPDAVKATDSVRRPQPCVPRSCGLSPTRRPPCCSAAPLLAVCAPYSMGTRPSTAPLSTAHRRRWCRRCTRRTRMPSRRRPRYAASANIGGATAARSPVCCAIVVRASRPPPASPLTTLSLRRRRPPRARAAGRQDAG